MNKITSDVTEYPINQICPWCGSPLTGGRTYKGHEGDFEWCPRCNAPFAKIGVGSEFTIGDPFKECTVYEITDIDKKSGMISTKEIVKVACSMLDKPNPNFTTYFSREHILSEMSGHYREDL